MDRLQKFLRNEELDPDNVRIIDVNDNSTDTAVAVHNGSFSWGKDDPIILKNINLEVKEGQLIAVVGQVGTGKSSLVAAMLGLMERRSGDIALKVSFIYPVD